MLLEGRLEGHLEATFPEEASPAREEVAAELGPAEREERRELALANADRHRWIEKNGGQQRSVVRRGYTRMADLRVSTTDPDASPMHQKKKGASRLGYQTHYVVDGGKARVVLDVLVAPAEVNESLPMLELLFRNRFRWRLSPRSVTGDAAYGTRDNVAALEEAGIRAYVALPEQGGRTGLFTIEDFVYDAERDLYTCPSGETLHRLGRDYKGGYVRYGAKPSSCDGCHLKALRKRAVWVEPLFAEAKEWHGFRRFRLRGLEKVNAEALMIASGQNVKRLVAFGAKGPRRAAQAAALRRPGAGCSGFQGVREHRRGCTWRPARPFSTRWSVLRSWARKERAGVSLGVSPPPTKGARWTIRKGK